MPAVTVLFCKRDSHVSFTRLSVDINDVNQHSSYCASHFQKFVLFHVLSINSPLCLGSVDACQSVTEKLRHDNTPDRLYNTCHNVGG